MEENRLKVTAVADLSGPHGPTVVDARIVQEVQHKWDTLCMAKGWYAKQPLRVVDHLHCMNDLCVTDQWKQARKLIEQTYDERAMTDNAIAASIAEIHLRDVLVLPQKKLGLKLNADRSWHTLILEDLHQTWRVLVDLWLFPLQIVQALPLHPSKIGLLRRALLDLLHACLDGGRKRAWKDRRNTPANEE
eukprot:CAMPEP_0119056092 /NCGR_PEP_ID=MMETSP1178-20130426/799_1 /TAXON_ID=33656 /ORGANISM="unid sp, Strain CCMP2000" /LENGTH=189 /DNA_ID=CAMNT_0007036785 /DNA_START=193 /DNA_END=763 /DNA_ORIENTATION=-